MRGNIIISLTFALSSTGITYGQTWKTEAKKAASAAFKDYAAVTLLDSTHVAVQETGQGTFSIARAVRINSQKGAIDNRILKYDYDPLTADAQFKNVTIHHADGTTTAINTSDTKDYAAPARAIYWGARQIMLEIGALKPGDIIEYNIEKKGFTYALLGNAAAGYGTGTGTAGSLKQAAADDDSRFIPPMKGEFYDIVPFWATTEPILHKVYEVVLPKEKPLQYKFYQGSCKTNVTEGGDTKSYTFISDDIMPFPKEPNMVDYFDAAPKLFLSTTKSWKDKSRWFSKVNEDYGSFLPIPEAKKKVAELIKDKKTEMEKIAVLTHWVADNIRYAGISMGKGEGYTLHNLKMDYTDRCGVCKDIAGTLISFLRIAGFKAYPAMTMAGSRVEAIPADHFNHCVAVVQLKNGTLMPLDPTWVPFCRELWSSAEQQQNYLPGTPEGHDLCLTPISAPENHYVRINADNTLDAHGNLTGTFTIKAEGQSDLAMRSIFTQGFQSEWQHTMEKQLLAVSPRARLVKVDYGTNPENYQAAPISITFTYEIPAYAMNYSQDKTMIFKPFTLNNLYRQVMSFLNVDTSVKERKYGFKDRCSRLVDIRETLHLPDGYKNAKASSASSRSNAADFDGSVNQNGQTLQIAATIALKKRVYAAADWTDFRRAVNQFKNIGDYIILKKN